MVDLRRRGGVAGEELGPSMRFPFLGTAQDRPGQDGSSTPLPSSPPQDGKGSFLNNPKIGPVLLGFLVFVVVGSLLLQIVRNATSGQKAIGV